MEVACYTIQVVKMEEKEKDSIEVDIEESEKFVLVNQLNVFECVDFSSKFPTTKS